MKTKRNKIDETVEIVKIVFPLPENGEWDAGWIPNDRIDKIGIVSKEFLSIPPHYRQARITVKRIGYDYKVELHLFRGFEKLSRKVIDTFKCESCAKAFALNLASLDTSKTYICDSHR